MNLAQSLLLMRKTSKTRGGMAIGTPTLSHQPSPTLKNKTDLSKIGKVLDVPIRTENPSLVPNPDEPVTIIKEHTMSQMYDAEIYGHRGLMYMNEDGQGLFVYHDVGEYKGKAYNKIRVCMVYKSKNKDGDVMIYMQRRKLAGKDLERRIPSLQDKVGLTLDMIIPLTQMLLLITKGKGIELTGAEGVVEVANKLAKDEADVRKLVARIGASGNI